MAKWICVFSFLAGIALDAQQAPSAPVELTLKPEASCHAAGSAVKKECEMRDTLVLAFTNLREWMAADPVKNNPRNLVLVLDSRVMKGLNARGPFLQSNELEFDLYALHTDQPDSKENREAWNALLSRSRVDLNLDAGVALGGNPPFYGPAAVKFHVFPSYTWMVAVALVALIVAFLLLAVRSNILRDVGPEPGAGKRLSFSLARCQMAWWFFIVVGSFLYIWLVTGDRDSVTTGALALIGISAATGLSAVVLDSGKRQQRQALLTEQGTHNTQIADLSNSITATPAPPNLATLQTELIEKQTRLAQVKSTIASLPGPAEPSDSFLLDILRDGNGVSFHRFQMAVWTLVLGFVFVVSVYRSLGMPDFSATLLGLMGISSGTYLGFKIPDPPK